MSTTTSNTPLAIVGIGCLFPKAAGPGGYWANVKNGVDGITEIPASHWNPDDYFDPDPKTPDMTYARRGGFLESKVGSGGGYRLSKHPRDINVGDIIRRLEGRLTQKDSTPAAEMTPGKVAVRLVSEQLTAATDDVLDNMTLEQLIEQVNKAAGPAQQEMYYI